MVRIFKKYFGKREERHKAQTRRDGFDFAAGAMLRGEETPLSLDAMQSNDYRDSFDFGMDDAIDCLVRLGVVEDNRV